MGTYSAALAGAVIIASAGSPVAGAVGTTVTSHVHRGRIG